ncbi:hypothetical protein [Methylorubrum zatmanii]|uniref:ArsR family transcriptional regulator n=1 Tax=Methylorubrum zatmanii TaxID=29429 RepID=A0ABW1WVZ1_9HYPH|nr:hypothetical protein [Methylorubrum zatmanii]
MRKTLTPARRKALTWIADHEPVSSFPCDGTAPGLTFVRKLRSDGLVREVGKEPGHGFFAFTRFALTDAGRAALAEQEKGDA